MCVWVETDTATPGMDDLCVNMISQPKMTEIPVKTVPLEGGGGGGTQTRGPDWGWDHWWLGWYTAGLSDRPYTVRLKTSTHSDTFRKSPPGQGVQ